jgi:hypothetical protein
MTDCVCATLAEPMVGRSMAEVPELESRVSRVGRGAAALYFRCKDCGTGWEEHWEPFMHVDVSVVMRSQHDAEGRVLDQWYDLRTSKRVVAERPASIERLGEQG